MFRQWQHGLRAGWVAQRGLRGYRALTILFDAETLGAPLSHTLKS